MLKIKFSNPEQLVAHFSIGYLSARRKTSGIKTLKQCTATPYPTLRDLALTYGEDDCPKLLLEAYITNLNAACNVNRMEEDQMEELGELIFEEAAYLKLTEMHEFFRRVKAAYYGEYYGSLDCIKVMADLREFLKDRQIAMASAEAEGRRVKDKKDWEERERLWKKGELGKRNAQA